MKHRNGDRTPSPEKMRLLRERGLELAGRYINSYTPVKVRASRCGHTWKVKLANMRDVASCRVCWKLQGNSIPKKLKGKELKKRLNGSKIQIDMDTWRGSGHPFSCTCKKCGYSWEENRVHFFEKPSCPSCNPTRWSLDLIKRKLSKTSIEVMGKSRNYSYFTRLRWRCKICAHEWETPRTSLGGCPKCAGHVKLTTSTLRSRLRAITKTLTVIESKSTGKDHEIMCRCLRCKTTFEARWSTLKQNGRCPSCQPHKFGCTESRVRKIFEKETGWKFPKAKPSDVPWLHGLHLDGYNKKHKTAFEVQGYQHYTWRNHFTVHKPISERKGLFRRQKKRDARKRFQCKYHGVTLICIPYWKTKEQIREKILARCKTLRPV